MLQKTTGYHSKCSHTQTHTEETSHCTTCHAQIGRPPHQEASKNQLTGVVADVILLHFLYGEHVCGLQHAAPPLLHVTLLHTRRQREKEKKNIETKRQNCTIYICIYCHNEKNSEGNSIRINCACWQHANQVTAQTWPRKISAKHNLQTGVPDLVGHCCNPDNWIGSLKCRMRTQMYFITLYNHHLIKYCCHDRLKMYINGLF